MAHHRDINRLVCTDGRVPMKLKIFSVRSGNRKVEFETLEADVNAWLEAHPDLTVANSHVISQPNMSWSHLALAVWYTDN
jgi:hypothetical protein